MPTINNPRYREFLDKNTIKTIGPEEFINMLKQIKHKNPKQARTLCTILYYTGCRPSEALKLTAGMIKKDGPRWLLINTPATKNGLPRPITIKYALPAIKEIWDYSKGLPENMYLFPQFRSHKKRTTNYKNSKGESKSKEYDETASKVYYYFNKWFGLMPYFFRHNRFSKMMEEGATSDDVKFIKGAKSMESVTPYQHMSARTSKNISKYIKN
jgi:integrase